MLQQNLSEKLANFLYAVQIMDPLAVTKRQFISDGIEMLETTITLSNVKYTIKVPKKAADYYNTDFGQFEKQTWDLPQVALAWEFLQNNLKPYLTKQNVVGNFSIVLNDKVKLFYQTQANGKSIRIDAYIELPGVGNTMVITLNGDKHLGSSKE